MNGQIAIERKEHQKSALRKILDTMKPYLAVEHGRKTERSLMKYAILLSEAELDCIVKLCQQAVVSEKQKKAASIEQPLPKARAGGKNRKAHLVSGRLF
jgi:hypothetical protein